MEENVKKFDVFESEILDIVKPCLQSLFEVATSADISKTQFIDIVNLFIHSYYGV